MDIYEAIRKYVVESLEGISAVKFNRSKVIHDAIHGSNVFTPLEITVLDLPLLQRLRRISQVDLVSLVFPSGNHNRFEHSIGVAVIAEKLARAVQRELPDCKDNLVREARLAGILHDCGHGPFSHLSEQIYQWFPDFLAIKNKAQYADRKPHEILSHLIITSEPFKEYMNTLQELYGLEYNVDHIAAMVIGDRCSGYPAYVAGIINGPFDADKLDYIQRDSHFTGVKIVLDLDRLFHTVCILDNKELSIDISGVSTLEQVMFDKMMLASTVYHHHKVRSAEAMFKALFEIIIDKSIPIKGLILKSAADFLYLCDHDILCMDTDDPVLQSLLARIKNRHLFKRALVISKKTVVSDYADHLSEITRLGMKPENVRLIREAIFELVREKCNCTISDIWVDLPEAPSFKEGSNCLVRIPGSQGAEPLRNIFPTDKWVMAFSEYKWQGYVFCPPEIREIVHEASKQVCEDAFGIKFNQYAKILCKMEKD